MAESEVPFVPTYIKEPKVFYDRKRGLVMLGKADGVLWLFRHNVDQDCWTSVREATEDDVRAVAGAMRR